MKAFLNIFFSSSSDESCDEEDDELLPKDPGTHIRLIFNSVLPTVPIFLKLEKMCLPIFLSKIEPTYFSEPVRRSSTTSRNLLNPPSTSDFYGRRPSSETPPLHPGGSLDKSYASSSNLNVLPIIGKTKMVQASKKAFLQVRNF